MKSRGSQQQGKQMLAFEVTMKEIGGSIRCKKLMSKKEARKKNFLIAFELI